MPKNISIQQMDVKMSPSVAVIIQLSLVIPLQGRTIEEVEEGFRGAFADAACKCMGKYIEKRDRMIVFEECDTKKRQVRKIVENRSLKLSYGEVSFDCRQIKDESGHSIPILKESGIPVKKKIVLSSFDDIFIRCAHSTYRKAQTGIENTLSLGTLHGEFQRRIGELRNEEAMGLQYLGEMGYSPPSPVSDTARVMDDAIYIRERTLPGRGKGLE